MNKAKATWMSAIAQPWALCSGSTNNALVSIDKYFDSSKILDVPCSLNALTRDI
jgi:hypothetical protein